MGEILVRLHRYDAAIAELQRRKKDLPQDLVIRGALGEAYTYKGMKEESLQEWEEAVLLGDSDRQSVAQIRQAFQKGGEKAVAELRIRRRADPEVRKQYLSPLQMAHWQAVAGHREAAIHALEDAYQTRVPAMIFIQTEPDFDFLHNDPRYRAIVQKMGLPPVYEEISNSQKSDLSAPVAASKR
jgi:hypothetical protein